MKRAFARSVEIIGEAAKQVPEDVRRIEPSIPRKQMAGMRDRVIHDYMGVDYDIVWLVAAEKASDLAEKLDAMLGRLRPST